MHDVPIPCRARLSLIKRAVSRAMTRGTQMIATDDDYERLPGLFGAWDLAMLIEEGRSYLVEDGGRTDDGQALFMVFLRPGAGEGGQHDG